MDGGWDVVLWLWNLAQNNKFLKNIINLSEEENSLVGSVGDRVRPAFHSIDTVAGNGWMGGRE